ncbi:hypothetical protein ACFQ3J_04685 [Paenibacillus provencensis]|uniref:Uncharacterized protein n=1 Tax=Paenibacillus provencensis TaxID=441151 RepID=A0ABW3PIV8_9BACL|nr:hypothetical protein [Paenibacillus sp. MER 78]MCM3126953.1 hypothetical protein [Paenibacillus sp. MER 78]
MGSTKRKLRKVYIILLITIDLLWFITSMIEYEITFFKKSNYLIPIILHVILFYLLARKSEGNRLIVLVIIITLSFFLLIKHSFTPIFNPFSYEYVTVPANKGGVIVEHRPNLIDQGIKYFRVYQTKFAGLFLTELTTKEVVVEEPYNLIFSEEDFFDYNSPKWTKDTVTFDTYNGELTLNLK